MSSKKNLELSGYEDLSSFSKYEIDKIRKIRWKCRTDIKFLIKNVLGPEGLYYPAIHDPMLGSLQKFPVPTDDQMEELDIFEGGRFHYKPLISNLIELPGKRDRLLLAPRSSGKTTFNCIAHTIQWIINYPGISIGIIQFSLEKAESILSQIKGHFTHNEKFRVLFPELCPPPDKIHDFGKVSSFSVPIEERGEFGVRKEETVMTGSIDSGLAGYHFEVIKYSDIVEPKNTENVEQCEKLIRTYELSKYLRSTPLHWRDVEGTRYSFADLYGKIIDSWKRETSAGLEPEYQCFVMSIFKRAIENPKYTPDELELPYALDENKKRISLRPEYFPTYKLEIEEATDPYIFSCQMLNCPIPGDIATFPDFKKNVSVISRRDFEQNVNIAYTVLSVDTAVSVAESAKYTAIIHAAVDRYGRTYVVNIHHGKWLPDDLVKQIIAACNVYRPDYLLMEKILLNLGLGPSLRRHWETHPCHVPVLYELARDNRESKQKRIEASLQTPFKTGDLRFVRDNIPDPIWNHLINEFEQFPKSVTNDIVDAIADVFQARSWFGANFDRPRQSPTQHMQKLWERQLGIEPPDYGKLNDSVSLLKPTDINAYWKR